MDKDDLVKRLREPRQGVHEDGTEEMKTWEQLWEQCREAAAALSRRMEVGEEALKAAREFACDIGVVGAMADELLRLDAELRSGKP